MRRCWGVIAILVACGDSGSGEASTSTSPSTGVSETMALTSGTGSTSGAESSTGEQPMYTPPSPTCRPTCMLAADCCQGEPGCPSQSYPNNYNCIDGVCIPPRCTTDAECDAGMACRNLFGIGECVVVCTSDAECDGVLYAACDGQTMEGDSYCRERCDLGAPCPLGTCDANGVCTCDSDDQCFNLFVCR